MFEFVEDLVLEVPKIEMPRLREFSEGELSHGLVVEIAAIHVGLTKNFNNYPEEALANSLESWVSPYARPIILNHDVSTEPIGRVMGARMDQEADGTKFVRLQAAILDPKAIEKVADKRYLTGSVGGRAASAKCSVCETDWAEATGYSLPCKHVRGQTYKGSLAYINMQDIGWNEYSFVNVPADKLSGVLNQNKEFEKDDWARPAHFFSINMAKEEVIELTESAERNVLGGLKKKDAASAYLSLKGGFLTALAEHVAGDTDEEESMASSDTDALLEDLELLADEDEAATEDVADVEDEAAEPETADEETEDSVEDEPAEEEATDEEAPTEEDADSDEEVQDTEVPQGQEQPHDTDIDPKTSAGAPPSREEDEEAVATEEDSETEFEASETQKDLELRVQELENQIATVTAENVKLRFAVKRSIAERVVNAKISLGLAESEHKAELLEDHINRSVSSLADTLKDLAEMKPAVRPKMPEMEEAIVVTDLKAKGTTTLEAPHEDETNPQEQAITTFVDVFMGRKHM